MMSITVNVVLNLPDCSLKQINYNITRGLSILFSDGVSDPVITFDIIIAVNFQEQKSSKNLHLIKKLSCSVTPNW